MFVQTGKDSAFAQLDIAAKRFNLGLAFLGHVRDRHRQLFKQGRRLIESIFTLT